ncbi:hypothetical protein K491DRAFT_779337 [Lophiostoma macrostomum CBS 122681]|uniref:RNase III domain-containing protein n=1 Tax=Lophiostoma macrostomum CBS 122681 TaxID=1314788 RepID=A0A6A6T4I9_9PLEO|nr:hypothetical protein K491DRAFT_779337 [Lophiostoma macrostomum CBS 122681]
MSSHTTPSKDIVEKCERVLAYKFTDEGLCFEALQTNESVDPSNARLATHGDKVVNAIISTKWTGDLATAYRSTEQLQKQILESKEVYRKGVEAGLKDMIAKSDSPVLSPGKAMATTLKALIGAVDLDGGTAAAETAMRRLGLTKFLRLRLWQAKKKLQRVEKRRAEKLVNRKRKQEAKRQGKQKELEIQPTESLASLDTLRQALPN